MLSTLVRRAAGAAAVLAFSIIATGAQAQRADWQGSAYLHSFSSECSVYGWRNPALFIARIRPSNMGANGPDSAIAFFGRSIAFGFTLRNARFSSNWADTEAGAVYASAWQYGNQTAIRVTNQTPRTINANTPVVRLVGQIRGFDDLPGCIASFDATMMRQR